MRCQECRRLRPQGPWAMTGWGWMAWARHRTKAHEPCEDTVYLGDGPKNEQRAFHIHPADECPFAAVEEEVTDMRYSVKLDGDSVS